MTETEPKQDRITAADVEQAFDSLFLRGKLKPSQKDILAELRRGSETTIRQHLNQLYLNRLAPEQASNLAVPAVLQQDMLALWQKACDQAALQWQNDKAGLQTSLDNAAEQQERLVEQLHALQSEQLQAAESFKASQSALQDALSQQTAQLQTREQQRLSAEQRAAGLEEQLAQAKNDLLALNHELKQQIQNHQQQQSMERQRMQNIEDSLHRKIDESRSEKKALDVALQQLRVEFQHLQQQMVAEQDQALTKYHALQDRYSALQQQEQASQILLSHRVEQAEKSSQQLIALQALQEKLQSQRDEAQELSIAARATNELLRTQLTQLQEALITQKAETLRLQMQLEASVKQSAAG